MCVTTLLPYQQPVVVSVLALVTGVAVNDVVVAVTEGSNGEEIVTAVVVTVVEAGIFGVIGGEDAEDVVTVVVVAVVVTGIFGRVAATGDVVVVVAVTEVSANDDEVVAGVVVTVVEAGIFGDNGLAAGILGAIGISLLELVLVSMALGSDVMRGLAGVTCKPLSAVNKEIFIRLNFIEI